MGWGAGVLHVVPPLHLGVRATARPLRGLGFDLSGSGDKKGAVLWADRGVVGWLLACWTRRTERSDGSWVPGSQCIW